MAAVIGGRVDPVRNDGRGNRPARTWRQIGESGHHRICRRIGGQHAVDPVPTEPTVAPERDVGLRTMTEASGVEMLAAVMQTWDLLT
ncbi:hypothetical protein Mvan_4418 [Mycolicibacterium vanbaalenii PYR-1]|uniref:Uncharacterized protein n=1 Tax=Mycolicibacterium vanbaalenii (strain DSM 7251 / JCM 13017 / BCRC 16820 / KCTC 9966 / NRRL B-24157 / PYR-1) TaxID=350058 RepID=A1TDE4_MYCVP|nr:hypothetical protein Mvan_4418 [Mycolicibacterium vanbaalenii PYR-1]